MSSLQDLATANSNYLITCKADLREGLYIVSLECPKEVCGCEKLARINGNYFQLPERKISAIQASYNVLSLSS